MKVSDSSKIQALDPVERVDGVEQVKGTTPKPQVDKVTTDGAEKLERAISQAKASASGSRAAKLAVVEAQIRAGSYQPSASQLADKLLRDAELEASIRSALQL